MGYVSPVTRTDLTVVGATTWNQDVVDNVKHLAETAPRCRKQRDTAMWLPTGVQTAIPWDGSNYDNASMHSTAVNPTRLYCPISGVYTLTSCLWVDELTTGFAYTHVFRNGQAMFWTRNSVAGNATLGSYDWSATHVYEDYHVAGDYLEVIAYQSTGSQKSLGIGSHASLRWNMF